MNKCFTKNKFNVNNTKILIIRAIDDELTIFQNIDKKSIYISFVDFFIFRIFILIVTVKNQL